MGGLLLDTHTVLWYAEDSPKLSAHVHRAIGNVNTTKYVSFASAWEVAIKLHNGKLTLDGGLDAFYNIVDTNGFVLLPIDRSHLYNLQTLPDIHKDPFDRLLVSTAMRNGMTIITCDRHIVQYNVPCLW